MSYSEIILCALVLVLLVSQFMVMRQQQKLLDDVEDMEMQRDMLASIAALALQGELTLDDFRQELDEVISETGIEDSYE